MVAENNEYKIYGYRWVVLLVYLLSALTIQMLWTTFFSITTEAYKYYGYTDASSGETAISTLSIIFMIGMIAFSVPSLAAFEKFGYKKSVGFGVVVMAVAAIFRGIFGDNYTMVLVCTVFFAVAQPFILNSVGIVPGKWFPARERATANGLGLMSSFVGMMIGLLVTPILLESGITIKSILMVYGIWSIIVAFLFLLLTRENPPSPPCAEEDSIRENFVDGLKILIKRPSFLFIFFGFFIVFGVFNTFFTLIEPILVYFSDGAVDPVQIGVLGVIILSMGIVGSVILPLISDKSRNHRRKPILLLSHIIGTVGFAAFLFTSGFTGMALAAVLYGIFIVGVSPVTMTFSAEVSYPVSEGTSEGLLMFAGNVSGVILLGISGLFGGNYGTLMIMLSVIMVIAWLLYMAAKEKIKISH